MMMRKRKKREKHSLIYQVFFESFENSIVTKFSVIGDNHTVPIVRLPSMCSDTTKKAMKFDTGNVERVNPVCKDNQMQPFEVWFFLAK